MSGWRGPAREPVRTVAEAVEALIVQAAWELIGRCYTLRATEQDRSAVGSARRVVYQWATRDPYPRGLA